MKNRILNLINQEQNRQETTINLIASENYASKDVLAAAGSVLTNKYAEGYPQKRYYGGCKFVDVVEEETIKLGKQLFNSNHINVQPHSGSSANMAVYFSKLNPGDTILGMSLSCGGHLTHGHKINFSGKLFNFVPYFVDKETELLDYDKIEKLAEEYKPKMIVAGASAYSRIIDFAKFSDIAKRHNALLFVDMAHIAGLVAAKLHPSPVGLADFVSSTTHKTLRGPRGGMIICKEEFANLIDKSVMPGIQGGPLMHIIAAKGIAFSEALDPKFTDYQKQVILNAKIMAKTLKDLGYNIVSGDTDNHLFLINLKKSKIAESFPQINGFQVEQVLENCNISLNRNSIPFDTESPLKTSGIRIGSPAITTRGFKEKEAIQVCLFIDEIIKNQNNEQFLQKVTTEIKTLCDKFPIYQ
ncbi:TPA: serine hydroxymethyltransferase [Candidatus Dependentiae bacterium]|nr:MAG: Serine hydroxymethyltransferase [candidate division TM6 bacterium GW2011_GWE2_31_21]KKP53933.1 MAG: Serine hydroxymethyltransferase [candidate division TM6 bacterium GW2011_GWF2_33_332]HBS47713.1 serine hydroxymethyltransferase [Candidatus Dependentiae bacterium]HBZ73862.1 serine hydroxymethyltransferase [Candidatus Dependentiae bacterium]